MSEVNLQISRYGFNTALMWWRWHWWCCCTCGGAKDCVNMWHKWPNMLEESGGQMLLADCMLTTIANPTANQVAHTCSGEEWSDAAAYNVKNCSQCSRCNCNALLQKKEMRQSVVSYCNCFMLSILKQSSLYQFDTVTFHPNNEGWRRCQFFPLKVSGAHLWMTWMLHKIDL